MYQDILNLNATTKSILKNPDNKSSLAHANSILRKDPTRSNIEGIGLNPNVPLEDEYIQNLQKQIHFMDLEIKLMKEKSAQEEALGGNYQFQKVGLNDGKQSMDHIVITTNKLKQMKIDMTKQISLLENDLMKGREDNTISGAKLANLARHITEYDEQLIKAIKENGDSLSAMRTKLLTEKRARDDVMGDIAKLRNQLAKVNEENAKLRKDTELRELNERWAKERFEEDEHYDHETLDTKKKHIDLLQMDLIKYTVVLEKDPRLIQLREENEKLKEDVKKAEADLDDVNYKVLEVETLQALSVKKKDEDQETRKKLQTELEKWRDTLDETTKQNDMRVERKLREAESPIIKELQAELLKERHELNELVEKFEAVYKREREYDKEQHDRIRHREDLTKKKEHGDAENKKLTAQITVLDPQVNELHTKIEGEKLKSTNLREERQKLHTKLTAVEEENLSLLSKFNFLQANIKLEDDMKRFNMEGLRSVQQTNQNVNETIKEFVKKWESIREFTKQL